jgi:hypothetical protein
MTGPLLECSADKRILRVAYEKQIVAHVPEQKAVGFYIGEPPTGFHSGRWEAAARPFPETRSRRRGSIPASCGRRAELAVAAFSSAALRSNRRVPGRGSIQGALILTRGYRVLFTFREMAGPNIQPCNRSRPFGEIPVVPHGRGSDLFRHRCLHQQENGACPLQFLSSPDNQRKRHVTRGDREAT